MLSLLEEGANKSQEHRGYSQVSLKWKMCLCCSTERFQRAVFSEVSCNQSQNGIFL